MKAKRVWKNSKMLCPIVLALLSIPAVANTITAGNGNLSYTRTLKRLSCDPVNSTYGFYYQVTVNNISYTDSTGTSSYPTAEMSYVMGSSQSGPCPDNYPFPYAITLGGVPGDIIAFSTSNGLIFSARVQYPNPGWINPKYKIIGVQYAPPGASSVATYADNTVVGASTAFSSSFSTGIAQTVSVFGGLSILGISDKETTTSSASYTQEADSSSSVEVSQTTSSSTSIQGYSDPQTGINHDYDYIQLWLNPILTFVLYEDSSGAETSVAWTGYGYDLNDTHDYPDLDQIGIMLGCLNGDFYQQNANGTNTLNWPNCASIITQNFSRTWALNNTDGSGPALTPTLANSSAPYNFCSDTYKNTDLYQVCHADPFWDPSYAAGQFPIPAGSYTTSDGRFTACQNSKCHSTIEYEPASGQMYSQGYSTTTKQSQGAKYTYETSYVLENAFGAGGTDQKFGGSFGTDVKNTTTYTWIDQFSNSTNTTQGTTASFNIVGPAPGYTGTDQFILFQDNMYGTFMFLPGN